MAQPPNQLKSISMYLKLAAEHDKRDPVIAYYCRLYAVQKGMEIDRRSPECKQFLMQLMDTLDNNKKALAGNDNVTNETLGQVYLEEYAMRLFMLADKKDRAGDFSQATIKSFYSAGVLMDVLTVFGDPQPELEKCRKYAKWKALYISQCLKNGEQPQAGPLNEEGAMEAPDLNDWSAAHPERDGPSSSNAGPSSGYSAPGGSTAPWGGQQSPSRAADPAPANIPASSTSTVASSGGAANLRPEDFTVAEKHCKYACSALQYQDAKTAIDFLQKALKLLTTGSDK